MAASVMIFAPAPLLTVTVEQPADEVELHIHPGGQRIWQARMITALDVSVTLCGCAGGEVGRAGFIEGARPSSRRLSYHVTRSDRCSTSTASSPACTTPATRPATCTSRSAITGNCGGLLHLSDCQHPTQPSLEGLPRRQTSPGQAAHPGCAGPRPPTRQHALGRAPRPPALPRTTALTRARP
jgi:hypothetical protein